MEAKKSRHANNIYLYRILKAIKPKKTENALLTYDKTYIKAKYGKDVELWLSGLISVLLLCNELLQT